MGKLFLVTLWTESQRNVVALALENAGLAGVVEDFTQPIGDGNRETFKPDRRQKDRRQNEKTAKRLKK